MTLPPGANSSGLLRYWRTYQAIFHPLKLFEDDTKRYGDIYRLGRRSPFTIVLSNPQAVKEIFTAPPEQFDIGKANASLSFLLGDNSLILMDGEAHQQRRRLLMPSFHSEYLQSYSQMIWEITEQVTSRWQVGKPFKVRLYTQEITLRVILQVVFGLESQGERSEQLRRLLSEMLDTISSPLSSSLLFFPFLQKDWGSWSPWGRFLRLRQQIKQLLYEEIRERRAENKLAGNDILTLLMLAKDEAGESLTDEELHDELMTLLIAGHETTASALVWALYWVHYLPEVREKLLKELNGCGETNKIEIVKLPYLNAVVSETLRIYPIVFGSFARVSKSPMELMGYQFEPETAFVALTYALHHREDLYPQAQLFRPERFLERQYSPHEFLPFGGGNRRCLGAALALMEMKLVLAQILSQYNLELISDRQLKPVRRGLTMAPPGNFQMLVCDRKSEKIPALV